MAKKDKKHQRPDGEIRRSQLLTAYGAGAMVDLVDAAILVSGLDAWNFHPQKGYEAIDDEPRLRDAIARRFQAVGLQLATDGAFRKPPAGDHDEATPMCGIPALIFPRWFVCQGCRALVRNDGLEPKGNGYVHTLCTKKRSGAECVPVRFVAACRRGHLQEFPWKLYVHHERPRDAPPCPGTSLKLFEGASGDFSEIVVKCETCGERQSMAKALVKQGGPLPFCEGHRPWLGGDARERDCTEPLRLLVRTGSNGYFAMTESALSIPEPGRELGVKVRSVWDVLVNANRDTLKVFRDSVPKVGRALEGYDDDDVLAAIDAERSKNPVMQEGLRTAEYRQLVASEDEQPGVVPPEEETFYARRIATPLPPGFGGVVLVKKLREVQVQVGFTRIDSLAADLQGEYDLGVEAARLSHLCDWLPAIDRQGEGVFLELDEAAVREWEDRPAVRERARALERAYRSWTSGSQQKNPPPFPGIRFYLVHSLSHLLMSAISLECGYSASALRERLYCSPQGDAVPMAAILITTGTSGTEGTLGGLVEQGRRIHRHLRQAWDLGRLCSGDPVCAGHSPEDDPTERFLEGAACHGCLYVAECSCERFNRYLDRALVVPTIGASSPLAPLRGDREELAFLAERP